MQPDVRYLSLFQKLSRHGDLSEDSILALKPLLIIRDYSRGELIVREGQTITELAYLVSGLLRSYYITDTGEEITSSFTQQDEFFTNVKGFAHRNGSSESIVALEDSTSIFISSEGYFEMMKRFPQLYLMSISTINEHRIELEERIRLLQHLNAKEKYETFMKQYPLVARRAAVGHIASFLGLRLETLSRVRSAVDPRRVKVH